MTDIRLEDGDTLSMDGTGLSKGECFMAHKDTKIFVAPSKLECFTPIALADLKAIYSYSLWQLIGFWLKRTLKRRESYVIT